MKRRLAVVAVALACVIATPAFARHKHSIRHHAGTHASARVHGDPRPGRWCGWYMRQLKGVSDRAYNLARKWKDYGSNAGGPGYDVIVVFNHHVGLIKSHGPDANGNWLVLSGNDGRAVRERPRPLKGAIAFRN